MAIKLADTLAPMADFPAAMAKDVWFSDNESLQEKFDNGDFSSSSELHGATIAVTSTNVELIGQRVTLSKNGAVVKSRTFNENLMCNFTGIQEAGEYTVSVSDGETLKEKTVTITSDDVLNKTVITVKIQLSNWLQNWIEAGRVTQSFSTLDEVFASEITVRQLMTIHASVDVLKEWMISEPEIVDTFVANATAMKWLGLRDYAYDTLTSDVDGLEEKILASDNWEYALKDHVPVMTSNTAPYGKVLFVDEIETTTYAAWHAFDGDTSTVWADTAKNSGSYIGYKFTNPINVRKFCIDGMADCEFYFVLQYSDDGTAWNTCSETSSASTNDLKPVNVNNHGYHLYWRIYSDRLASTAKYKTHNTQTLQFYGRSLNVSVPTMTSNTAPYGEAITSSEYVASTGKLEAYQPFAKRDKNKGDVGGSQWASVKNSGIGEYIGYDFKKSVVVKQLYYAMRSDISLLNDCDVVLEGFDGVSWNSIIKFTLKAKTEELIAFSNNQPYSKYRLIYESTNYASDNNCQVFGLQFYGVDYSEREFAEGSTMSYIYDHGIEFSTVTVDGTVIKNNNVIELSAANSFAVTNMDTTNYSLLRGETINNASGTNTLICGSGLSNFITENMPNNHYLDISSINGTNDTGVKQTSTGVFDLSAMWLE